MKGEKRKQILTISILVVSILVITIGFAAFSATLRITSSATVNPDSNTFSVKFSTTKDTLTEVAVKPNNTSGITATDGKIDNTGSPTISNLSAEFKVPGDYVEYVFYARNEGEYNAYLNNINFIGQKTCEAAEGTSNELVQSACSSISLIVTVGGKDYTTTTGITDHILNKNTGEEIKVTLKYEETGVRADGPFAVNFGQITMVYSTVNDSSYTPPSQAACSIERQVAGTYTVGDVVTCGEEQFYVIENELEDTTDGVDMLAMYNLTLTESPIQDKTGATNPIAFSSTNYWYDDETGELIVDNDYESNGRIFPYIYGDYKDSEGNQQNLIYPYVSAYETYLKETLKVISARATLMSYDQAIDLGCVGPSNSTCEQAPTWLISTNYWLGSTYNTFDMYISIIRYSLGEDEYSFSNNQGIRPLITIQVSDLG